MSAPNQANYHDPVWWNELEDRIYPEYEQFNGRSYSELTDDDRTEIVTIVARHVAELHTALRTLALENHPKRVHARKPKANGNEG